VTYFGTGSAFGVVATNNEFDSICCRDRILVLPHSDHLPSEFREAVISVAITLDISTQLLAPERFVRFRKAGMGRAAVPEAAVDEDSNPSSREGDVCATAPVEWKRELHPKSQAPSMQLGAQ
jgi:hypothetical protein